MNPGMSAALLKSRVSSSTVLRIPGADIDFVLIARRWRGLLKSPVEEYEHTVQHLDLDHAYG